jgi:hypothetical protein
MAALIAGDFGGATKALGEGKSLYPPHGPFDLLIAHMLRRQGRTLDSQEAARLAYSKGLSYWAAWLGAREGCYLEGQRLLDSGADPGKGLALLRRSTEMFPASLDAWLFLGKHYQETGEATEALRAFYEYAVSYLAAFDRELPWDWYRRTLSLVLLTKADSPPARELLERCETEYRKDALVPYTRAFFSYLSGDSQPLVRFLGAPPGRWASHSALTAAQQMMRMRLSMDAGQDQHTASLYRVFTRLLRTFENPLYAPCWPGVLASKIETNPNLRVRILRAQDDAPGAEADITAPSPFSFSQLASDEAPGSASSLFRLKPGDSILIDLGKPCDIDGVGIRLATDEITPPWTIAVRPITEGNLASVADERVPPHSNRAWNVFRFEPLLSQVFEVRLIAQGDEPGAFQIQDCSLFRTTRSMRESYDPQECTSGLSDAEFPPELFRPKSVEPGSSRID